MYGERDAERIVAVVQKPKEDHEPYRTPWRRDAARITHSPAFRRQAGKSQLFPGTESDYFRNRLTHSLEVAQIGASLAIRLNATEPDLDPDELKIDHDIVQAACLVHDIGHPPFGHQGEIALDKCMRAHGGFEGNAQTFRILARLEKRDKQDSHISGIDRKGRDRRCGLNLTARTLAATLKYDREIAHKRSPKAGIVKGYYGADRDLVKWVKECVTGNPNARNFKTVECQIMDIADDIAYSTYDLEDALKAGFLTPANMVAADEEILNVIVERTQKETGISLDARDVVRILFGLYRRNLAPDAEKNKYAFFAVTHSSFAELAESAYQRIGFTSALVGKYIQSVRFKLDARRPALSTVWLDTEALLEVNVLKHFTYASIIRSPRIHVVQHRSMLLVKRIVEALCDKDAHGHDLMPLDFRRVYKRIASREKRRVICDFVACMTDRYATQFFGRLASEDPASIFTPF